MSDTCDTTPGPTLYPLLSRIAVKLGKVNALRAVLQENACAAYADARNAYARGDLVAATRLQSEGAFHYQTQLSPALIRPPSVVSL